MNSRWALIPLLSMLAACSGRPDAEKPSAQSAPQTGKTVPASTNPVAKYIELTGFRLGEKGPKNLRIRFGAVNHSDADLGDVVLEVQLHATNAKPGEPPLATFSAKIPAFGPGEWKDVEAVVPTKLRVYELPDWQYIRADFQIAEPK